MGNSEDGDNHPRGIVVVQLACDGLAPMTLTFSSQPTPDLLDRHQRRRDQSIPTISLLCGPVGLGVRRWQNWTARRNAPVVALSTTDFGEVVYAWVRSLAATRDLIADAIAWLAQITEQEPDDLRSRIFAMTGNDFEWFWRSLAIPPENTGPSAVCHLLLAEVVGSPTPDRLSGRFLDLLSGDRVTADRQAIVSLAHMVPATALPTLLLSQLGANDEMGWLLEAAGLLAQLVAAIPALPAAIVAETTTVEVLFKTRPLSQALTLLREGHAPVKSIDEAELAERLRGAGVEAGATSAVRRLVSDGTSEELAAAYAEAARRLGPQPTLEEEEAARSAAEQFLFERLETLPATAGLFTLNEPLDFRHGRKPAEVDLHAASLRLAIELDGSYFHLHDPMAYRRDRRKDWELQRRGYLVLRFLSEDVVERLEEILDTILAAVELRRSSSLERGRQA